LPFSLIVAPRSWRQVQPLAQSTPIKVPAKRRAGWRDVFRPIGAMVGGTLAPPVEPGSKSPTAVITSVEGDAHRRLGSRAPSWWASLCSGGSQAASVRATRNIAMPSSTIAA